MWKGDGATATQEIPGPCDLDAWCACWRVFRSAGVMVGIAAPTTLDRYEAKFKQRFGQFRNHWDIAVLADLRCRTEFWIDERRQQEHFMPRIRISAATIRVCLGIP